MVLNKLVDERNNTYHRSIDRKPINAEYSSLFEELRRMINLLSLNLVIESKLLTKKYL